MTNSYKPGEKTEFISIQLNTTDMDQTPFYNIAAKINKHMDSFFKIFLKTASGNKFTYTPAQPAQTTTYKAIANFLED